MLKILTKNAATFSKKLGCILKPIEKELSLLEDNLTGSIISGNAELDRMVSYFFNSGGKRLRPAITILFGKAVNSGLLIPENFELAQAVEMVHTASLIHDDVIDDAKTRRGILTLNKKWSAKIAVITGDYVLTKALGKLTSIGLLAVEIFADTLNELCIGEILQKNQSYKVITLDEYINKSERKTAKLFMAGTECAASIALGTNNVVINAAREYSLNFGIAFQIMDDILNFVGNSHKVGKPAGNDLKSGIITAPAMFAVQEYEKQGDSTLRNLIESGIKREKDFKKAMKLILTSNGIQKAELLAEEYIEKAVKALDVIEDNEYKQSLIDLAYYAAKRYS